MTEAEAKKLDADVAWLGLRAKQLADALYHILESLSQQDDEGLIEHAQQIITARKALDDYKRQKV